MDTRRSSRALLWVGATALVLGAIDPLEGSIVIVIACAVVTVAAYLGHLHARRWAAWGVALATLGVAALWATSAAGGIGGSTGRSYWWALLMLPYPVGWILSLSGAIRGLRER